MTVAEKETGKGEAMEQQTYEVGGFSFTDEALAGQAKKELEAVKYLRSKTNRENPEMVLAVYHQMMAEDIFRTPVGICYLKELQEYLRANPRILNSDIREIPIHGRQPVQRSGKEEEKRRVKEKKEVVLRERNVNYKSRYRRLLIACAAMAVMIAAMFAITLTSNSPNILNYENQIINKYEDWEQQLKDKENELKEREKAFNEAQAEQDTD